MIAASVLILLVAGGALLWQTKGRTYYARWQRQRQMLAAEAAFRSGDCTNAVRLVREVGGAESGNLRAAEIAATCLEKLGSPDSLFWWRRLAELKPNDDAAVTAWAYAAFRHDDLHSAYLALRKFPRGSDSAAFHDIAGRIALSRDDRGLARTHFARALALAPENAEIQLRFAEVHADAPTPAEHDRAVAILEQLATHAVHSAAALGALTREALQRGDAGRAQRFSTQLLARPGLTFADRLVHLSTLKAGNSAEFAGEFARMQAEAAADPALLPRWLAWNSAQNRARPTLEWFLTLPPETQNLAPVMDAVAGLYVTLADWKGLKEWVFNSNWAALEYRRIAYQSLAAGQLSLGGANAPSYWQAALREAKGQADRLQWLAAHAETWALWTPMETTLWLMVQKEVDADGALERLARLYRRQNQADNLLRVARRQLELHPRDPSFEADLLYLSALLKVQPQQLKPLADRVRENLAKSSDYATALAMFLSRSGGAEEGLAVLEKLPAAELSQPSRKALHILLLAQVSDRARARTELERVNREGLLRPEAGLIEEATVLARAENRSQ